MMWTLEPSAIFPGKLKRYQKKHSEAAKAVLDNLDTYHKALLAGAKPPQIRRGFVHDEPNGVFAIDQRGAERKQRETRLYVYPDEETQTLYLITIGDKSTQKRQDLTDCREFVDDLRKAREDGQQVSNGV